jgi:hypothetical protein
VLLSKKVDVGSIADYRSISLIHSFSKVLSEILASRLTPLLPKLVSHSQSTFIKKRSFTIISSCGRFDQRNVQEKYFGVLPQARYCEGF